MSEERKQCASDLTDQAVDTGCAFSGTGFVSGAAAYLCVTGIHMEGPGTVYTRARWITPTWTYNERGVQRGGGACARNVS